jgi:uncharacterized phage protein (TIGR02220 family)
LLVLLALADNADEATGLAWPSLAYLAKKTRKDERWVQRCLRDLERAGAIRTERRDGRSNHYYLMIGEVAHTPGVTKEGVVISPGGGGHIATGGVVISPPITISRTVKEPKERKLHCSAVPNQEEYELLDWVNTLAKTHYRPIEVNLRLIRARLRENDHLTLAAMVRRQWHLWRANEQMRPYFRPATLFGAEKCAQYVGQLDDADRRWMGEQQQRDQKVGVTA